MDDKKILELLREHRGGLTLADVFQELRTPRKERAKVEGRLIDLENRRAIRRVKNRYLLPLQSDLVRGRFETGGRGFGFVVPENGGGEDIFIPARFAKGAMHGDTVEALARERGRPGARNARRAKSPARETRGGLAQESGGGDELRRAAGGTGSREPRGKAEGQIVRVLKKQKRSIVGLYTERYGAPFLVPLDAPSREELPLVSRGSFFPAPGALIAVDRTKLVVTDVFGRADDPGVDTEVVIRKFGLAVAFPEGALAEAEAAASTAPGDAPDARNAGAAGSKEPRSVGGPGSREPAATAPGTASGPPCCADLRLASGTASVRVDYRGWTTFTIDGETAQDFDDAVSIRRAPNGNFLLGVHIADVSHYVAPGGPLDREAYGRATSVYFPDRTLPMLPERLSNDVCSLRPREDRLTVSAVMEIDEEGVVVRAAFHPSIIRTAERLTYASVFKIFEGDAEEAARYAPLVADLGLMRKLARVLRARRVAEGSLDFDLLEPELVYREGRLHSIAAFAQNEAHKLIEEFMVAANVAVASYLEVEGVPLVFRVHPRPGVADLDRLRETLAHFGIMLPKPDTVRSQDLQRAIRAAEGGPGEKFVNVQVLRAMRLAVYSPENVGHYGLAKASYCHFTSPIRRYPDLMVHRILKAHLRAEGGGREAGEGAETGRPGTDVDLAVAARHSSERERNADAAEKDLVEWRIFRFLKERLGDELDGVVVDITRAGLAVELDDYFVQGLVAYEDMGGDFFIQRSRGVLAGRRSGKKYELGQRLRVAIAAVDPILRRMSLIPC